MQRIPLYVACVLIGVAAAVQASERLQAQAPQADAKPQTQERLARVRASLFSGTGRPDDAVRELKEILATDPESAEGTFAAWHRVSGDGCS